MNECYESALMKARKLAALASGGVEGERVNAQRLLEAHLRKHGLRLEQLRTDDRTERWLPCFDAQKRPVVDQDLWKLGIQCLSYVLNEKVRVKVMRKHMPWKSKQGKSCKAWGAFIVTDLTELEWEDWIVCFHHFRPHFEASQKRIRDMLKACLSGFIQKHDIIREMPAEEMKDSRLTPKQLEALIAAMRMAQGEGWTRPKGRLEQSGFMLVG